MKTCLTFTAFAAIFLISGISLLSAASEIKEASIRYDVICKDFLQKYETEVGQKGAIVPCEITLNVPETIPAPVYVYYTVDNFYQNHRRYVKSRSNAQLLGQYQTLENINTVCDPIRRVSELFPEQQYSMFTREELKNYNLNLAPS